ncbi:hypothetical protein B0H10DRAFT_1943373 [Mycena sp. CBHHK59/15]|nr:hypothetical protein B0H10DRAFT_1943373 [Mycena sp. CBHHK59/15]
MLAAVVLAEKDINPLGLLRLLPQGDAGVLDNVFDAGDRPEDGDVIVWWNDLEKTVGEDNMVCISAESYFQPSYPEQFHNIKLNLFDVVLVLDLSRHISLNTVTGAVASIIGKNFPFRCEDGKAALLLGAKLWAQKDLGFLKLDRKVDFAEVLEEESTTDETRSSAAMIDKGRAYADRLSADLATSSGGHAFVNWRHLDMDDLYGGKISDETTGSIGTYFYDLPTSSLRRNRCIFPASGSLRIVSLPDLFARSGFRTTLSTFIYPPETELIPLTLTREGSAFINTADSKTQPPISWLLSHLLAKNLHSKASPRRLLRALGLDDPIPPSDGTQIPLSKDDLMDGVGISGYSPDNYAKYLKSSRLIARDLQLAPGQQALIVNGRVIGPIPSGDFLSADFKALESYELRRRAEAVTTALESIRPSLMQSDRASSANLISMSASVLSVIQAPEPNGGGIFQRNYRLLEDQYSSFQFGDNSTALYQIAVLVEPLSEMAQKWSNLLEHLNGYRSEIQAQAIFEGLPIEPIYTLVMDVPPSWLVRPREALCDLDNIQLGNLSPQGHSLGAVFDLDYLVVEGHARDPLTNAPPRGPHRRLEALTIYPRLSRLPGKETEDVLDVPVEDPKVPGRLKDAVRVKSIFQAKDTDETATLVPVSGQADINIFTAASGLLYERFVSIMILSVLRNTNSTVKFWFIENFLSPSFLAYKFCSSTSYSLWIIFVDADQIVRADLKELVDLDLHGAPYEYTPMGDDNVEMEGFRFWWLAAGLRFFQDILRGQYQQLSADPGSLANLDQDLPNNLQWEVPIFSLHEDWLWRYSELLQYSSKDRLHRAKTIDLCQNPLTIPEWEEYDSEISRFSKKLAEEGGYGRVSLLPMLMRLLRLVVAKSDTSNKPSSQIDTAPVEDADIPRDEL